MIWMKAISAPPACGLQGSVSAAGVALHAASGRTVGGDERSHELAPDAVVQPVDMGVVDVPGDPDHLAPLGEHPGAAVAAAEVPFDAGAVVVVQRVVEVLGHELDEVVTAHRSTAAPPAHRSAPVRWCSRACRTRARARCNRTR